MDPRLMVLGWAGVAVSLLILARVAVQVRSHQRDTALVMITDDDVRRLLAGSWSLFDGIGVEPHDGGMGSRTWIVERRGQRWVLKAVAPHLADSFAKGLEVAQMVESADIPAGAPVPTVSGEFTVDTAGGWRMALLTWVPGAPLSGADEGEQRLIGTTLARVHLALHEQTVEGAQRFHWVDPAASRLDLRSWIRPAVSAAVADLADLELDTDGWPRGLLHADPAPEAFRCDASGRCGVIDWGSALHGPLLYDVASAAMYLGGRLGSAAPMIDAYRAVGPLTAAQLAEGLPVLLRFRWAVQADYFAWRITENDLTGISGPEENEKGLEDARRALLNVDG
jgi:homoserine kinase type II